MIQETRMLNYTLLINWAMFGVVGPSSVSIATFGVKLARINNNQLHYQDVNTEIDNMKAMVVKVGFQQRFL
jgi:hypothetical protein